MKSVETYFFDSGQNDQVLLDTDDPSIVKYCKLFSCIISESIYILDVQQEQLCFIKSDDPFICSLFTKDVLCQGFNFYTEIVYPPDLCLCSDMFNTVLKYIRCSNEQRPEIDYFSCTFRLQRRYSFHPRPLSHMTFHRIKHVWVDNELRYLICSVRSSTAKKSGNLRMYNMDGLTYKEYNYNVKRWQLKVIESLTEREKAILLLAQQGKTTHEIADELYKGYNTIRNQIQSLFAKLNVHTMQEAIEYACYHYIIYSKQNIEQGSVETGCKRSRVLLTEDILKRIQQYLHEGKSIRQSAKLVGISESAIRYWKEKGNLYVSNHRE